MKQGRQGEEGLTGGLERREDLPVNEFSSALRGNLIDSCKCANMSIRRRSGIRRTRVPESYRMMMVLLMMKEEVNARSSRGPSRQERRTMEICWSYFSVDSKILPQGYIFTIS